MTSPLFIVVFQTWGWLAAYRRFWDRLLQPSPPIFYMSYFPVEDEAGPEMPYDFSPASAHSRWRAGSLDMEEAMNQLAVRKADIDFLTVIRRSEAATVDESSAKAA